MALEHITRADDPTLLPLARSKITSIRASGLKWGSQRLIVGRAIVTAQVKGRQSYISVEGYSGDPIAMDSGIIDVGAYINTYEHADRYLAGQRRYIPEYEHIFNLRVGNTPWYVHLATAGQIAGTIALGTRVTGSVRKDTVTAAYSPSTYPVYDSEGQFIGREDSTGDERLLEKKRAGIYCPASMFTGRARLYAQAMFGRPLYTRQGKEDQDEPVPTPSVVYRSGAPYLGLPSYGGVGDGATLNFNSGVYFDPISKKHWLLNPGQGSITIYPLIADELGERARIRLRQGKLNDEDALHLETYVLSSCRPDTQNAVTLTITEIVPWASGYGWHWNWSGDTADMVRVDGAQDRVPFDSAMYSTHYRLTVTAVYDPDYDPTDPVNDPNSPEYVEVPGRFGDTTWSASAGVVSGPHLFMMQTPVVCVTHPNWTNRYAGEDLEHAPVFWSEKLTLNFDTRYGVLENFTGVPLYAFYKKDELQLASISLAISDAVPAVVEYTDGYVTPLGSPTEFYLRSASIGNDSAYLRVQNATTKSYVYTITCGTASVSLKIGEHASGYSYEDSAKTTLVGPGPLADAVFFGPGTITLRSGRPFGDMGINDYEKTYVYAPVGYAGYSVTQYGTSSFTSQYESVDRQWYGVCGGTIPFYDAEAFYMMQDTYHETITNRYSQTNYGNYLGYDGGEIVGGGSTSYVGWSTFELFTSATGSSDRVDEPQSEVIDSEVKVTFAISSCGESSRVGQPPGAMYGMFADGFQDYVAETFSTIGSAGLGAHFRGIIEMNWPEMPGMRNPVIVGWV